MMVFANRENAALKMIPKLQKYRGANPLVLAIPRGAVVMAEIMVNSIGGELDVLLVSKITSDALSEIAIGAVSETGFVRFEDTAFRMMVDKEELDRLARRKIADLQERRQIYAPLVKPGDPKGRTVIIVDDGIATGATMLVAIESIRALKPQRIVIASPVASNQAIERLKEVADELVVLHVPEVFGAVSQFYEEFGQVSDADVIHIMSESRKKQIYRESRGMAQTLVVSPVAPSLDS
jgi:predicted phosphoribosyltransferase